MNAGDLRVEPWEHGAALHVKAHPGSRREGVAGLHDGMLKIEVTAPPEKGKANKAIAKLLAKVLRVPTKDVTLLSGDTVSRKRFGVTGLTAAETRSRLVVIMDKLDSDTKQRGSGK